MSLTFMNLLYNNPHPFSLFIVLYVCIREKEKEQKRENGRQC